MTLYSYSGAPRGSRASPERLLSPQRNVTNVLEQGSTCLKTFFLSRSKAFWQLGEPLMPPWIEDFFVCTPLKARKADLQNILSYRREIGREYVCAARTRPVFVPIKSPTGLVQQAKLAQGVYKKTRVCFARFHAKLRRFSAGLVRPFSRQTSRRVGHDHRVRGSNLPAPLSVFSLL